MFFIRLQLYPEVSQAQLIDALKMWKKTLQQYKLQMFESGENRRYSEMTSAKSEDAKLPLQSSMLGYKYLQNDVISSSLTNLSPFIYVNRIPPSSYHGTADMTLIETPAPKSHSLSLDQFEEGIKSISRVIVWANDKYQPDNQSYQLGDSEHASLSSDLNCSHMSSVDENLFQPTYTRHEQKPMEPHPKYCPFAQPLKDNIPQMQDQNGKKRGASKKGCNCKKSQCLKLYCDCFRENKKCEGCACFGCHNTEEFDLERDNAKIILIDRNPSAFKPKIESRSHAIGCNCKKTSCQKKYCECYQAGLQCGVNCKCEDCKNFEPAARKVFVKKTKQSIPLNFKLKNKMGPPIIVPVTQSIRKDPVDTYLDNK